MSGRREAIGRPAVGAHLLASICARTACCPPSIPPSGHKRSPLFVSGRRAHMPPTRRPDINTSQQICQDGVLGADTPPPGHKSSTRPSKRPHRPLPRLGPRTHIARERPLQRLSEPRILRARQPFHSPHVPRSLGSPTRLLPPRPAPYASVEKISWRRIRRLRNTYTSALSPHVAG